MRGKILDYTTQIESLLTKLGATGRGMHEKLDSIESKIEVSMVKKIRWIASLRNKAVHEGDFNTDINDFIEGANDVINYLQALLIKQQAKNTDSTSRSDSNKNIDSTSRSDSNKNIDSTSRSDSNKNIDSILESDSDKSWKDMTGLEKATTIGVGVAAIAVAILLN